MQNIEQEAPSLEVVEPRGVYLASGVSGPRFGTIVKFSHTGSEISFGEELALEVGSWAKLRYSTSATDSLPILTAQVTERSDRGSSRVYGFRHQIDSEFLAELDAQTRLIFEPRTAKRLRMLEPVSIRLSDEKLELGIPGLLIDISTGGAAIEVPEGSDAMFTQSRVVLLNFNLGPGLPFSFVSTIRHRKMFGSNIRYGLKFEIGKTPSGTEQVRRLSKLVGEVTRTI